MRALITGVTGFAGGHLAEYLLSLGDQVVGASVSGKWPAELADMGSKIRTIAHDLGIGDPAVLVKLLEEERPDVIYHLAAQASPGRSREDPRGAWRTNLGGTLNLLESVRTSGSSPRIVLVGTGASYGNPAPEHLPVNESCPLRPTNPYAASKAAADMAGLEFALGRGGDLVVVRPFNHTGARQSDTYVLSSFARQIAEIEAGCRDHIDVGNLEVVRDFTDVRDVVRAYRLLAEKGVAGEVYNLGTGRSVTLSALLDHLISLARVPVEVRISSDRLRSSDHPIVLADASKLHAATGWAPCFAIEQTLSDTLEYWRAVVSK